MENKSNFFAALSLIGNGSWFMVEENQKHVIFFFTVVVTILAIISYIGSIKKNKRQSALAKTQKEYYDKKIKDGQD